MAEDTIVLLGCGDVGPMREPVEPLSALARPALATGDIRFCHCDRLYSEIGEPQVGSSKHGRGHPSLANVFSDCDFNVISLAGNPALDWGYAVMLDTKALLESKGIKVIGAGRNLEEARRAAIIEKNGVRVAFLAYGCIVQPDYEAGSNKAGIAPLRVHTYYEAPEYQPGMPARVVTIPHEKDFENMLEDVAKAKKEAHAVVLSFHWGIHYIPRMIAKYQPFVAKAAFKAGADLIFGHHPHVPKAIGVHDGKVCFYSLGQFIFSTNASSSSPGFAEKYFERYGVVSDIDDYPYLPYGADSKHTLIAKALISREGVRKVSFLPGLIDKQYRPEMLSNGDPRFDKNVSFMDWVSEGYDHKFKVDGNEVVITA